MTKSLIKDEVKVLKFINELEELYLKYSFMPYINRIKYDSKKEELTTSCFGIIQVPRKLIQVFFKEQKELNELKDWAASEEISGVETRRLKRCDIDEKGFFQGN